MTWSVADAVDYKGFPADKSKTGGWVPAALSLGTIASTLLLFSSFFITNDAFDRMKNQTT